MADFQRHFRLSKSCFEIVLNELGYAIINQEKGRPPVPLEKQLLCTLWVLGNPEALRSISDRFDMAESTV